MKRNVILGLVGLLAVSWLAAVNDMVSIPKKIKEHIAKAEILEDKQIYVDALKEYYYVGGMPEAVVSYSEEQDFAEVRNIQNRILAAYEQDFSKHAPANIVPKIRMVWNSIPSQLAKENRKFL